MLNFGSIRVTRTAAAVAALADCIAYIIIGYTVTLPCQIFAAIN